MLAFLLIAAWILIVMIVTLKFFGEDE